MVCHARPPCRQLRHLTLWLKGTRVAGSGGERAAVLALAAATADSAHPVSANTLRADLRALFVETLHTRIPQGRERTLRPCFPALLANVLRLLDTKPLALALDATNDQDRCTALVISVLYRRRAIPVAWTIREGTEQGAWLPLLTALITTLPPAIPAGLPALLLADEGVCSRTLFQAAQAAGSGAGGEAVARAGLGDAVGGGGEDGGRGGGTPAGAAARGAASRDATTAADRAAAGARVPARRGDRPPTPGAWPGGDAALAGAGSLACPRRTCPSALRMSHLTVRRRLRLYLALPQ